MIISTREAYLGKRQLKPIDTSSSWMTLLKYGTAEWSAEARNTYPEVFPEKKNRAAFYGIDGGVKSFIVYSDGHIGENDTYTMSSFSPSASFGVYYNTNTKKLLMSITEKTNDEEFLQDAFKELDSREDI